MGISIPLAIGLGVAAAGTAAATVYSADQQRKATHQAMDAQNRAAAALAAEQTPGIPTSDVGRAARRASIAQQMKRRGRASTILTDTTSDPLGG